MVKKLRKRVVIYTMIAVFLVLFILMGVVNLANYISKDRSATEMLEFLAENGGRFPGQPGPGFMDGNGMPGGREGRGERPWDMRPGMTEETPYETRFFTVAVNKDGSIVNTDIGQIAAVTEEEASEMVESAEARDKDTGYYGNYKYMRKQAADSSDVRLYIFLDCTRDLTSVKNFLKISLLVSLFGLIAIAILVILLSPRMIKPMAESYEKQKEFITNAGHELKTPMAVIESCTEVIEMQSGESKWTAGIRDQVKKLTALTGELVSLARMEESADKLEMQNINLSELAKEVLGGFELEAEKQGRNIVKEIESDVNIKGNKQSLSQLISILIDNALKYAREESDIKISIYQQGKKAMIVEENEADGLTPGSQEAFFDRFYRGDTSHNNETEGHGIGLSLARSIVNAHGGSISAVSPDGERLIITAKI